MYLTFEAGDGFKSSGWTLGPKGRQGEAPWQLLSGPAPQRAAIQTGPPFDHTFFNKNGHYLYSQLFDFGLDAWFVSPMLKPTNGIAKCMLTFYYYMYGMNENQIELYVRNVTQNNIVNVNTMKAKSEDMWRSTSVQLQSTASSFQVCVHFLFNKVILQYCDQTLR